MREDIAWKLEGLLATRYKDLFYVANHIKDDGDGRYLWVYRNSDQKMIMVIHGGEWEEFEIKLITADEGITVDKRFEEEEEMIAYLENKLLDDLMVYEI